MLVIPWEVSHRSSKCPTERWRPAGINVQPPKIIFAITEGLFRHATLAHVFIWHATFRQTFKRVRLDKDWIVPTHWSWMMEPPLVGQVCRSNRCSVIQWEQVGKYQSYPVRTLSLTLDTLPLKVWKTDALLTLKELVAIPKIAEKSSWKS